MSQSLIWLLYYAICAAIGIYAHPLETDLIGAQLTTSYTQTLISTVTISRSRASQTLSSTPGSTSNVSGTPPPTTPNETGSGFPTGTRIGAAVGGSLAGLLICTLLVCWIMKRRKNNKRRLLASGANSKKPISEKDRAPASSTATSEAAEGNDRAQERLRSMHKSSTL